MTSFNIADLNLTEQYKFTPAIVDNMTAAICADELSFMF